MQVGTLRRLDRTAQTAGSAVRAAFWRRECSMIRVAVHTGVGGQHDWVGKVDNPLAKLTIIF